MKDHLYGKAKHMHPIVRILFFIIITAIFYIIISISISKVMSYLGLSAYMKGFVGLIAFFISYSLIPIVVILGTYVSLRVFENKGMKDIGLSFHRDSFKEILIGISLAFIMTGLIFGIEFLLGWIKVKGFAWNFVNTYNYIIFLFKSFILYISVALTEEIFTRGYIMNEFEAFKGKPFAIIASSIIFGLFHLYSAIGTWAIYVVPFSLSLAGVLFALLFYLKKSLWIPIGFHFAWNFFEYQFFSLTGYGENRSVFFVTELTGPNFWVGLPNSSFGPEVGALGVLIISICILGIYLYKKTGLTIMSNKTNNINQQ